MKQSELCFGGLSGGWPWDRQIQFILRAGSAAAAPAQSLQLCPTLRPHRWQPTRLLHPWDLPGKSTGGGCHCLLHYRRWTSIRSADISRAMPMAMSALFKMRVFWVEPVWNAFSWIWTASVKNSQANPRWQGIQLYFKALTLLFPHSSYQLNYPKSRFLFSSI